MQGKLRGFVDLGSTGKYGLGSRQRGRPDDPSKVGVQPPLDSEFYSFSVEIPQNSRRSAGRKLLPCPPFLHRGENQGLEKGSDLLKVTQLRFRD